MAAPSYSTRDPRGWGGDPKRGAAMGRHSYKLEGIDALEFSGRICLRRVRIDSQGYDRLGTYWGVSAPLYWYGSEDSEHGPIDACIRASDRDAAVRQVQTLYPRARLTGRHPHTHCRCGKLFRPTARRGTCGECGQL